MLSHWWSLVLRLHHCSEIFNKMSLWYWCYRQNFQPFVEDEEQLQGTKSRGTQGHLHLWRHCRYGPSTYEWAMEFWKSSYCYAMIEGLPSYGFKFQENCFLGSGPQYPNMLYECCSNRKDLCYTQWFFTKFRNYSQWGRKFFSSWENDWYLCSSLSRGCLISLENGKHGLTSDTNNYLIFAVSTF